MEGVGMEKTKFAQNYKIISIPKNATKLRVYKIHNSDVVKITFFIKDEKCRGK